MLIRRWADKDAAGAPRVCSVTVGTAEVNDRTHPRNVMVCDDYVPPQWVRPLERIWESAEADAGQLLKESDPREIIADDERHRTAGGGAVRRLMVVHLVRGFEAAVVAHHFAERRGEAAGNDPMEVWAWQERELQPGGLILPWRIRVERAREAFTQHAAHSHADRLAGLYGGTLVECEQHSLEVAVAPPGCEFVLGDSPAFTVRSAADGSPLVGLGANNAPLGPGTMLVMPLGPTLCGALSSIPVFSGEDTVAEHLLDWLNEIQCDRALRTVVCTRQAPSALVDRITSRVTGRWGHDDVGDPLPPPPGNGLPPAVWAPGDS
ncbi:MAG: hypothetical protein F4022_02550 [Gemmatimonadetes bacterium]|nr:hypothetical protein [Gemmatimonadota bacterium]